MVKYMIIAVDIDDTICNTKDLQKILWKEYYLNNPNENYSEELPININHFGNDYLNNFWDTYRETLFAPKFKDGVSEVFKILRSRGIKIYIVTSRPINKYKDLHGRIKCWLNDNNIYVDDIICGVNDKGLYVLENNIDLLIYDDLRHITSATEKNKDVIQVIEGMIWFDILERIEEYL